MSMVKKKFFGLLDFNVRHEIFWIELLNMAERGHQKMWSVIWAQTVPRNLRLETCLPQSPVILDHGHTGHCIKPTTTCDHAKLKEVWSDGLISWLFSQTRNGTWIKESNNESWNSSHWESKKGRGCSATQEEEPRRWVKFCPSFIRSPADFLSFALCLDKPHKRGPHLPYR